MEEIRVIILGAGRPNQGVAPAALTPVQGDSRLLDWLMAAFKAVCRPNFQFVGGYHFEEIAQRYPEIKFSFNPNWQSSGSVRSLLSGSLPEVGSLLVTYADIVLRSQTIAAVLEEQADIVLGMDSAWRERYASRSEADLHIAEKVQLYEDQLMGIGRSVELSSADGEFIGLFKANPAAVKRILALPDEIGDEVNRWDVPMLIERLRLDGLTIRVVDCAGQWAEMNAPEDLAHFVLGTKAETLSRLRPLVQNSHIGEQVTVGVADWREKPAEVIASIRKLFPDHKLAVRSSARSEDSWSESNAGGFTSLLNIESTDPAKLGEAIDKVINSYGDPNPAHQVLVQAVVGQVVRSGVVLTRGLGRGAPYYTVNFEENGSTEGVTSGASQELRTVVVHRSQAGTVTLAGLEAVLQAVIEIETLLGYDTLDIEFAQSADGQIHILQVRPLVLEQRSEQPGDDSVLAALQQASELFERRKQPEPWLLNVSPIYGVMPDWNPAEIVGTNPRPLALSLYQYLITDEIWARQRAEHGYRDVRPQPLLISFSGHPYVDARASFASFLPAAVSDTLAARLLAFYVEHLIQKPELHDKVEFEIAFTCLYFDFEEQAAERLSTAGFSHEDISELKSGLLQVTQNAFQRYRGDLDRIKFLEARRKSILAQELPPLESAYALLQDCRDYGTLPFAHLARAAFIAITMLRSLVRLGILDIHRLEAFLNSLNTVTRGFEEDGHRLSTGEVSLEAFLAEYGHLRPGTYEITSPNYAENPELYLGHIQNQPEPRQIAAHKSFAWSLEEQQVISKQLAGLGLAMDFEEFDQFLRHAIAGRESSKFVFTRSLSAALDALAKFGDSHGLSRKEMAFIHINDLLQLRTASWSDMPEWLSARSKEGLSRHRLTESTALPPLIWRQDQFWAFEIPGTHPNFVSSKHVVRPVVSLTDGAELSQLDLKDKIVLIPQADPGYDWLFGRGIAGLITAYGGANSHMTIRAAELNLPAAIGVGEALLAKLQTARMLELDCKAKRIQIVQ